MNSHFFSNTIAQVGAVAQAAQSAAQTEVRVGSHTVQIHRRLAEGGFGVVELVSDVHTKQELVLKRCNIDRPESFEIANTEIKMLQKFKGPYVVNLIDSCIFQKTKTTREALLLMEYYPGDHLLNRLLQRNNIHLPADSVYRMFGQLCLGVKEMHLSRPPIVHRDLKLENVLFGQDGKVRICDFGSCVESPIYIRNVDERTAADEHIQKETTQMYRAPEMVDLYLRPTLTEKTDIWALGCMLYAMCFLIHPFMDGSSLGILNAKIHFPADSPFPEDVHTLILRLLDIDPECRPSIVELIDWVTAIAHNKPLPAQVLSAEAEQCRATRIASTQLRESKANGKLKAKQAAAKPQPKKPITLSSNSVAARRLATMRGQAPEEHDHHEHAGAGYSDSPSNATTRQQQQHHSPAAANADSFDPFGQHAESASSAVGFTAAGFDASFDSAPVASFAAFQEDSSFDPFGTATSAANAPTAKAVRAPSFTAPSSAVRAPSFTAAPASSADDGFSNFAASAADAWDQPTFASAPATSGFDAFEPTNAPAFAADDGFAPTAAAAGFSAFDDEPSSFDNFAPTSAGGGGDAFAPVETATSGAESFNPFEDSDFSSPPVAGAQPAAAATESLFDPEFVSTPTESSSSSTFANDSFFETAPVVPAAASTAAVVLPLQSAASLLFDSYEDDATLTPATPLYSAPMTPITPAYPAPAAPCAPHAAPSAQPYDPWATTEAIMPAAPVRPTAPPKPPKTIDIFGDDLLHPAPVHSAAPPKPAASSKPRNPLDLLSLYDQPLTPSQPHNAMMSGPGSGMGSGTGLGRGMSPVSAPSPMGFRQAGMPMQPMQPMQLPLQQSGMLQGGMSGSMGARGSFSPGQQPQPQQQGRGGPMMMSPQGGSSSMYGGAPVPSMSSAGAGSTKSIYSTTPGRASTDPFDSINMLKR